MHAVVVRVTVNDGEAATSHLREEVVPRVSQSPGFVAGHWVRLEGSNKGTSMLVFESEDAAREAAGEIVPPPNDAVVIDSVDVGEVVESA